MHFCDSKTSKQTTLDVHNVCLIGSEKKKGTQLDVNDLSHQNEILSLFKFDFIMVFTFFFLFVAHFLQFDVKSKSDIIMRRVQLIAFFEFLQFLFSGCVITIERWISFCLVVEKEKRSGKLIRVASLVFLIFLLNFRLPRISNYIIQKENIAKRSSQF